MATPNLKTMEVEALLKLRSEIDDQLVKRRSQLQQQLAQLDETSSRKRAGRPPGSGRAAKTKGRKVAPKYRSKKDPKLTWAGRGATPVWMREEMKGTKLKKDAFLIK
jgi:DNA-binding protein H-NS